MAASIGIAGFLRTALLRLRPHRSPAAVAVSALAAALWLFLAPRPLPPQPVDGANLRGTWLEALVPPGEIAETPDGLALQTRGDPSCRALLVAAETAPAEARRFGNQALLPPQATELACLGWFDSAAEQIRLHHPVLPVVRPGDAPAPVGVADRALLLASALLVGALIALLGLSLGRGTSSERRMVLWVIAISLLVRLAWPWRLTAVYFGYEWLAQAATQDSLPRYGPGSTALWGMVLGPVGDHRAVLALQALVGAATCGVAALALRRAGALPSAGWAAGLGLALTPVVLRDHTSESMHVPALLGLTAALWAGAELGQRESRLFSALLLVAVAFAALCRFDVGPLALAGSLAMAWITRSSRIDKIAWSALASKWVPPTLVVALTLIRGLGQAERDLARGNLPQLAEALNWLPQRLTTDVLLWRGDWLPLGWWLGPLAWLAWGKATAQRHHRWLALIPLAFLAVLPSWLDYNETSLPRLQQPAALLAILASAALGAQVHAQTAAQRWLGPLAVAVVGLTALPTLETCLRQTNAHTEDQILRRAAADLKRLVPADAPAWLAVRSYADGDTAGLHLHQPTWLFGAVRLTSVSALQEALQKGQFPDQPVYFLRSVRCHAAPRRGPHPGEMPACSDLADRPGTQVIWQESIKNLGDTETFDWYGREPQLVVGLYRVASPMPPSPPLP